MDLDFSRIKKLPFTPEMVDIFDALGINEADIPAQYRPTIFRADKRSVERQEGCYLCYRPWRRPGDDVENSEGLGVSQYVCASAEAYDAGTQEQAAGDAVLRWMALVRGSAPDKILRRWLGLWGWRDPKEATSPPPPPMVL